MIRLANAPHFSMDQLVGHSIQSILGASNSPQDDITEMLFLKLVNDTQWHRLFLDAGIGFWEKMSKEQAFADYEDHNLLNYAACWNLVGSQILIARCEGGSWEHWNPSSFCLVTNVGVLGLKYVDVNDLESATSITFLQS